MPLAVGTTIGTYKVIAAIGAGGMGEVYRAIDTKLNREVALKVLPPAYSGDTQRLARFQREAQMLAALNHPSIALLYGIEESAGSIALVMELVEGEDLAHRIARGRIPVKEAVVIARQIAEALDAAHTAGIVHRDLKPANIKLRDDGTVKVLDFGLAKALEHEAAEAAGATANSPTSTSPVATEVGMILGTAAYMSPEQARGKKVDKRTDIWAFGCVVYEMLSGIRPFDGETITDMLAAIIHKEPDWANLPADTPGAIRRLLLRCLQKDAKSRLRDIGDIGSELESEDHDQTTRAGSNAPSRVRWAAFSGWVLFLIAAGAAGWWRYTQQQTARPLRVSIVHTEGGEMGAAAISPDGGRVAYVARQSDGMPMLWVRNLASAELRAIAGTEDASFPFWSPDSRQIGFFSGAFLKRVSADGGPIQVITDNVDGRGGAWAPDDTIVFRQGPPPLFRVNAAGGTAAPLTKLQGRDWSHFWPSFLPDGRKFLFTAKQWTRTAEASEQGIFLGSLDSSEARRLLPDLSSAVYAAPGYIVFVRNGRLTAAPFDLASGQVSGEPVVIGGSVATDSASYFAAVSAAADGTLAVRPPPAVGLIHSLAGSSNAELHVFDRSGASQRVVTAQPFVDHMALAPDERHVAAQIENPQTGTSDLWLFSVQTGSKTPLTTSQGYAGAPVWSKDGTQLAFAFQPPGGMDDVRVYDLRTGRTTALVESAEEWEHPVAWSHDGGALLVDRRDANGKRELWKWSFAARTFAPFLDGGASEAVFSPNDRYVALTSERSGRAEVSVTTFPEQRQTWPLTGEGGRVLSWRADGREILVATVAGHIVAYPVIANETFSSGEPAILFRDIGGTARYAVAERQHSRVVARINPDAMRDRGEVHLLFHWAHALR